MRRVWYHVLPLSSCVHRVCTDTHPSHNSGQVLCAPPQTLRPSFVLALVALAREPRARSDCMHCWRRARAYVHCETEEKMKGPKFVSNTSSVILIWIIKGPGNARLTKYSAESKRRNALCGYNLCATSCCTFETNIRERNAFCALPTNKQPFTFTQLTLRASSGDCSGSQARAGCDCVDRLVG